MKIIDCNFDKAKSNEYRPILINKNYCYFIKFDSDESFEEAVKTQNYSLYSGMYRYNIKSTNLEKIRISEPIIEYYNDNCKLYYLSEKRIGNEYWVAFYKIYDTEEKKLVQLKLQHYKKNVTLMNINDKLTPFMFKDGFILYSYDVCTKDDYNRLDDDNEYKIFIYDINDNSKYEILDREFCKNGFNKTRTFESNGVEYSLFNACLYNEEDKREYMYDPMDNSICEERSGKREMRGERDSIFLIQVETFINEIKEGKKHLSYKILETIGQEGTVRLIKVCDSKVFYEVLYFNRDYFELVIYDLRTEKYTRVKIEDDYRSMGLWPQETFISISEDGKTAYLHYFENKHLIVLNGENFQNRDIINISETTVGVIKSKYLITRNLEKIDQKNSFVCNIYDINSLELLNKIEGEPIVFEGEETIVVY